MARFCNKCGEIVSDGMVFCPACGEPLKITEDNNVMPLENNMGQQSALPIKTKSKHLIFLKIVKFSFFLPILFICITFVFCVFFGFFPTEELVNIFVIPMFFSLILALVLVPINLILSIIYIFVARKYHHKISFGVTAAIINGLALIAMIIWLNS